ncbi:MAG TPA: polysaccharide deacetylase family protein [Ktedonobacteraceae bacterium]|nr:polysaccharide deacetylase family protein [Ktedonobacteraceae bacterium]
MKEEQPSFENANKNQPAKPAFQPGHAAGGEAQPNSAPYWVPSPEGAKLVLPANTPQQGPNFTPSAQQGEKLILSANPPQQGPGFTPLPQQGPGFTPPPQQGGKLILSANAPQQGPGFAPPAQQGPGFTPPPQQAPGFTPPPQQAPGFTPLPQQGPGFTPPPQQGGKLVLSANAPQQGTPVPPAILPESRAQLAPPSPAPLGMQQGVKAPEPAPGFQRSEMPGPVNNLRTVEKEPTRLLPFNRRKFLGKRTSLILAGVAGLLIVTIFGIMILTPHPQQKTFALSGQWSFPNPTPHTQPVAHLPSTLPEAVSTLQDDNRFFYGGNPDLPEVALTFDDGPSPAYTPRVLDILKQFNIHATFFDVGNLVETYPDLALQEFKAGHTVGNHTWSHPDLPTLSQKDVTTQLQQTSDALKKAIGVSPVFMRPPYGDINDNVLQVINNFALSTVIWNVDPEDWALPGTPAIVSRVLSGVSNGSIVLMHDGGGVREQTVQALPTIIEQLRARGYKFVTLSELAAHNHHDTPKGTPTPRPTSSTVNSANAWDCPAMLGISDIGEGNARKKADF